jgi:hypothetical protein
MGTDSIVSIVNNNDLRASKLCRFALSPQRSAARSNKNTWLPGMAALKQQAGYRGRDYGRHWSHAAPARLELLLLGGTPAPNFDRSGCRTKTARGFRSKVRTKKPIPGRPKIGAQITSFNFVSTPEQRDTSRGRMGLGTGITAHLRPRADGFYFGRPGRKSRRKNSDRLLQVGDDDCPEPLLN